MRNLNRGAALNRPLMLATIASTAITIVITDAIAVARIV